MPNPFGALHVSDDEEEFKQTAKAAPSKTKTAATPAAPATAAKKPATTAKATTYTAPVRTTSTEPVEHLKEARKNHESGAKRDPKNERQSHNPRSGSARGAKREGKGKGNWGKAGEELNTTEVANDSIVEETPAETAAEATPAAPEVDQPKSVSFEEWKRSKEKQSIKVDSTKLRKANEGADNAKWANAVPIKRDDEEEEEDDDEEEHEDHRKNQRSGRKQYIDVAFNFSHTSGDDRGERTERGRGRGRGRGGRGGTRPSTADATAPSGDAPAAAADAQPAAAATEGAAPQERSGDRGRGRGRGAPRGSRGRGGESRGSSRGGSKQGGFQVNSEADFPKL